jgi:uncharacterized protein (DUF2236 family)
MTSSEPDLASELAGDWRFLLLVGTGLLMQVAHPVIGGGVADHSSYQTDPFGRFDRSVWPVLAMVIMGDEAASFSADLRAMHRGIGGVDHEGRRYHAWDPEGAFLVPATACYAAELSADLFGSPLSAGQREQVYAGWRRAALDFGIPEREVPVDHAAYREWLGVVSRERLEDHPTARAVLSTLRRPPAPPRVPRPLWAALGRPVVGGLATLVTVGTLPPDLRERLGLEWTRGDARKLAAFAWIVRRVNAVLPRSIRTLPGRLVRRRFAEFQAYAAHGADLGIAPSMAATGSAGRPKAAR